MRIKERYFDFVLWMDFKLAIGCLILAEFFAPVDRRISKFLIGIGDNLRDRHCMPEELKEILDELERDE